MDRQHPAEDTNGELGSVEAIKLHDLWARARSRLSPSRDIPLFGNARRFQLSPPVLGFKTGAQGFGVGLANRFRRSWSAYALAPSRRGASRTGRPRSEIRWLASRPRSSLELRR